MLSFAEYFMLTISVDTEHFIYVPVLGGNFHQSLSC